MGVCFAYSPNRLLRPHAHRLLITLAYDQAPVEEPPFSVPGDEVDAYWPDLVWTGEANASEALPPSSERRG